MPARHRAARSQWFKDTRFRHAVVALCETITLGDLNDPKEFANYYSRSVQSITDPAEVLKVILRWPRVRDSVRKRLRRRFCWAADGNMIFRAAALVLLRVRGCAVLRRGVSGRAFERRPHVVVPPRPGQSSRAADGPHGVTIRKSFKITTPSDPAAWGVILVVGATSSRGPSPSCAPRP